MTTAEPVPTVGHFMQITTDLLHYKSGTVGKIVRRGLTSCLIDFPEDGGQLLIYPDQGKIIISENGYYTARRTGRSVPRNQHQIHLAQVLEMSNQGKKESEIAEAVGIHKKSVSRLRVELRSKGLVP